MTNKILLIVLMFFIHSLYAQNNESPYAMDIKIGLTHAPPIIILHQSKPPDGMLVDFLKAVAASENWKITWIQGSWSDVMSKANNSELDVMTYIAYTPERAQVFNFSTERFVTGWGQLYSYENRSINNILDLNDKRIAVMRDDIHAKRFAKLCLEYAVNCLLVFADDYDSAFKMLEDNLVSGVVSGSTVGISYEKKLDVIRTPVMFNPSNALFASPKSKSNEPLKTIDNYLIKWRSMDKSPYSEIQKKWMSATHKDNIPMWVKYVGLAIIVLFFTSVIITLFLRKQIKKHVKQHINQTKQLEQIINLVPHMIYVVNSKGEVVLVNKYASKHFGVTVLSNFTKHQLLHDVPQYSNLFDDDIELIQNGKGLIQKELVTQNNVNEDVTFNIFKVPFDTTNKLPSVLTVGVDITEQLAYQKQIQYMALHDDLTNLPNRQLLKERIIDSLKDLDTKNTQAAVLYIDLDFFKSINDSLGHAAGDKLLKVICERLIGIADEDDMVARIGGDEFILQISNLSKNGIDPESNIKNIANKVIVKLAEKIIIDQQDLYISASIGIVVYPNDGDNYDQIMQRADIAMYQAKAKGRNKFILFEEHMENMILERHILVAELRNAIKNSEFDIVYQPQIYGNNDKVIGFEALIRWNHPNGKVVGPDDFIPIAEESGLIIPIGNWVLEQACQQVNLWLKNHETIPFITVNLSVLQLHNKTLVEYLQYLLTHYKIPPHLIELEVTETVMVQQIDKTIDTLSQLKNLGVRLSIDDFGTGYSSLSYLNKLPFDKLKIDYSFVKNIVKDSETKTIVKTIIGMTKDLDLEVIAEGVETIEQLELLTKMGCHNFQGYYFDAPNSKEYIEEKYLK